MIGSKEIFEEIRQIEMQAMEGEVNELSAFLYLKEVEKAAKAAKESIDSLAQGEADNWTEKTFNYDGFQVEKSQTTKWDFSRVSKVKVKEVELKSEKETAKQLYLLNEKCEIEGLTESDIPVKKTTTFLKTKKIDV